MLAPYAIGLTTILTVVVVWVGVQIAWRRVFPDASTDPDVLAGRLGCGGCGCTDVCEKNGVGDARSAKEGIR